MPMLYPSGRLRGVRPNRLASSKSLYLRDCAAKGKPSALHWKTSGVGAGPNKPFEPTPRRRRGSTAGRSAACDACVCY